MSNNPFPQQGGSLNTWGTQLRTFFGTYFNLTTGTLNDNVITYNNIVNENLDGAPDIPSMRTLGTGAQQACGD